MGNPSLGNVPPQFFRLGFLLHPQEGFVGGGVRARGGRGFCLSMMCIRIISFVFVLKTKLKCAALAPGLLGRLLWGQEADDSTQQGPKRPSGSWSEPEMRISIDLRIRLPLGR